MQKIKKERMIKMSKNAAIFYRTNEGYLNGIYIEKYGEIESLGKTLVYYYDYDKVNELVNYKWSYSELENTIEASKDNRIGIEYYIGVLQENALKHRQCFQYDENDDLLGESVDYAFIPYTRIQADYVYLIDENNQWLVSYDVSDYEFEDLKTNLDLLKDDSNG